MPSHDIALATRQRLLTVPLVFLLAIAVGGCLGGGNGLDPGDQPQEGDGVLGAFVWSGAIQRTYTLHVPASLPAGQSVPLVVAFHGYPSNGINFQLVTGLDSIADRLGFVVVYPDGIQGSWAAGCECTTADLLQINDIRFVRSLLNHLSGALPIDTDRMYAAGFSQGGSFVQRVACELSDRIAAVTTVGATMVRNRAVVCLPPNPRPMIHFHGTEDQSFLWSGALTVMGAEETVVFWAGRGGCDEIPILEPLPDTADDGTTVTKQTHSNCANGSALEFYGIEGGGHQWPGSDITFPGLGVTTQEISASELLAEFLLRHSVN